MKNHLNQLSRAWALGLTLCLASTTMAQTTPFPSKTIKIVVPNAAGGAADITARTVAQKLSESLGQSVVTENKPSAGGIVAGEQVARAEPDGHTLLLISSGTAVSASLFKTLPFDTVKDFIPVSKLATFDLVIAVAEGGRFKTFAELMAYAKANPGKMNFAVGSIGSAGHLCTVKLEQATGTQISIVPYKGTGPAMTDLVGGQIEGFIDPVLGSVQFHRNGQLKVVGVTSSKRLPNLPDVATVSETIPDFQCASWYGLWGPTKLPADMVQKLNAAVNKALSGEMRDRLIADGIVPAGGSPAEFAKFQADDIAISGKIIADKKIAVE